jgi:phage tail sheath protein FI
MGPVSFPGVYVEEIPGSGHPITGVATGIAAFVGWASKGPVDTAESILSWADYESTFGGLDSRSLLGYAVFHFFANGGQRAYIVRLAASDATVLTPNDPAFEDAVQPPGGIGGIYHLDRVDLFNLLCVPGETNPACLARLQKFCRDRRAFLIADCASNASSSSLQHGPGASLTGDDAINAAFYFPWVLAPDALQENRVVPFPPSGFVAGVYARTDSSRGVWKAPAGVEARLNGAVGATPPVTDPENDVLNRQAVNCIRTFPLNGTVLWGARTLHGSDARQSDWKYVPVRRTALFIEESLRRGLTWAVVEPNDSRLWARIRIDVGGFLHDLFRQGAFQGRTVQEACFVKCDGDTTTQSDIDGGVVNIHVGFAPLKPAEFVLIRIQQIAGQTQKNEDDPA